MKVLWFLPIVPKAALERKGKEAVGTGFWIHCLIEELIKHSSIELSVVYIDNEKERHFSDRGVQYFPVSVSGRRVRFQNRRATRRLLDKCKTIIDKVSPDVVHVHGTESPFGLIRALGVSHVPTVVSIQGLMGPCCQWVWGDKTLLQVLAMQRWKDFYKRFPLLKNRRSYARRISREDLILREVDAVIGRTEWDRSYTWKLSAEQLYYHVDEIMRPGFYQGQWMIERAKPHSIFCSGRVELLKGMYVLVEAVNLLRREFPNIELRIAGQINSSTAGENLHRLIDKYKLRNSITLLGWLPEEKLLSNMRQCNVYANSSFIENGCNSLQEAMLQGMPCVAAFTGGLATTLKHGDTGLMYPRGDVSMLATAIRRIFVDPKLAQEIGVRARSAAVERHNPDKIVSDLINTYSDLRK